MAGDLKELADRAVAEIKAATDEAALEAARVKYLGRKGALSEASKRIANLRTSEKPAYGAALNDAKGRIESTLDERGAALRAKTLERDLGAEREDMTLPPRRVRVGRLHPITQTVREVSRIFGS
ncbi:MAG TPA: phenylalanine--tRNA ligase subunit alpha, partial [Thermoanaerobaculia bacterium]|nr:phenylalanine--tRNA ligase subunit alpha [Thermoanaerobaculia bacterium]